jgi:Nucleotidyl transferase AbiEii toxin, Type IV TA system
VSGPTRGSVEGRVYLDLQNKARRDGRPNAELQQLYVLEGFLARLAGSPYRERFVLKGGVLLAAFGTRRPTRDVDFQALHVANDTATVRALVIEVAGLVLDDGLVFNTQGARAETIRDEDEYSGVRVTMTASLARAQVTFHIDVNVGDPVSPAPVLVSVPRLLGGDPLALSGYPLPMVHAEKLVTALQRGTVNTRWRDFADVWTLSGRHPVNGDEVQTALRVVAEHRRVQLARLADVLDGYAALAQGKWGAWRRKQQMLDQPEQFNDLIQAVIAFADPALTGQVRGLTWNPTSRQWQPPTGA